VLAGRRYHRFLRRCRDYTRPQLFPPLIQTLLSRPAQEYRSFLSLLFWREKLVGEVNPNVHRRPTRPPTCLKFQLNMVGVLRNLHTDGLNSLYISTVKLFWKILPLRSSPVRSSSKIYHTKPSFPGVDSLASARAKTSKLHLRRRRCSYAHAQRHHLHRCALRETMSRDCIKVHAGHRVIANRYVAQRTASLEAHACVRHGTENLLVLS